MSATSRWAKIADLAVLAGMLTAMDLAALRQSPVHPIASWLAAGGFMAFLEWRRHRTRSAAERDITRIHEHAAALSCESGPVRVVLHRPRADGYDIAWTAIVTAFFASPLVLPMRLSLHWAVPVVVGLLLVAVLVGQLVRRSPLLVLGLDGVEFTRLRLTLPWSALGHARASVVGNGPGLRWELIGPEAAMARSRLGALRRRWALRRIRKADGAIEIPVSQMRETPEVALAASWRLAREHGALGTGVLR